MNILFLGCIYSDTQKELFMKKSRRGYQFAAQNLQESLVSGFLENDVNLTVLSIPALSTFPQGCKLPFIKSTDFILHGRKLGKCLGYLNFPFLNYADKRETVQYIDEWYNAISGPRCIFVYALQNQQMAIAIAAKRRHPDIVLCIIVPDLPRFMGCNKYYKMLGGQEKSIKLIYERIKDFDCMVVLAEPMVEDLGMASTPYVVVEGIWENFEGQLSVEKDKHKVILYTGNIAPRYGITKLMSAFEKIEDKDYRLWIRGTGDNSEVLKWAERDKRIKYIGPLSKPELLKLQKKATLLVNPVPPSQEFTRYFFPSKTMDYLASGTPTLMFALECLPEDYLGHIYLFSGETEEQMCNDLIHYCSKPAEELRWFGSDAARFIRSEKNPKVQTAKIIDLITKVFYNDKH